MSKSYQIYVLWYYKHLVVSRIMFMAFTIFFITCLLYFLLCSEIFKTTSNIIVLSTSILISSLISFIVTHILAKILSSEDCILKLDNNKVEIKFKRLNQKILHFSYFNFVEFFQYNGKFYKTLGVNISLEKNENAVSQKNIKFEINLSVFSGATTKKSYKMLNKFIDDFSEQLLQHQFALVFSCEQTSMDCIDSVDRTPSKRIYTKSNKFKNNKEMMEKLFWHTQG